MTGDFLLAAQLIGSAAAGASLSAQVRTPAKPSPSGSPDRAMIRLNPSPFEDMAIPHRYDLEVVCNPLLAVIPPMGGALLPGGLLIVNAPTPPAVPPGDPWVISADLTALSVRHGAPLGFALSGAAWAGLKRLAPELNLPRAAIENASPAPPGPPEEAAGKAELDLLREAYQEITSLLENA